jgi:hypothetical protein
MVDNTTFLPGLSPVSGKAVVARFDGGRLSLIDQYCASFGHVPKRIVLDIDDTFDP